MKWAMFAFPAFGVLLTAVVFHFLPSLRKRRLLFSVTVDDQFRASDEARRIIFQYRVAVWGAALTALALSAWALDRNWPPVIGLAPLVSVLVATVAWIRAWHQTRPFAAAPTGIRSAPVVEPPVHLPGGWVTVAAPFVVLAGAACWMMLHYDELPARYPVHWGASGHADRWVDKSRAAVLAPAAMGAGILLLLLVNALLILRAARRGAGGEKGNFGARQRKVNVQLLAALAWALGPVFAMVTMMPVISPQGSLWPWLSIVAVMGIGLFFVYRLYSMSMEDTGGTDGMPEECWKLGFFYFNPADPALIVEKRSGPGYTMNFGNRLSWLILVGMLALVFVPMLLIR